MAIRKPHSPSTSSRARAHFTAKQGQYLTFIDMYRKMNRRGPSEVDIAKYFRVSPPSVNQMMAKLETLGLITRQAGVPRSARVAVSTDQIPALDGNEPQDSKAPAAGRDSACVQGDTTKFYTLEVFLIAGPVPESFGGKVISRTIQIRGDQTLQDLHQAIFRAFDRWDEHLYEFQFGKGPHDPQGSRYVLPSMLDARNDEPNIAGEVTSTTLDSLHLDLEKPFGYWFDFGDDWWHQIDIQSIEDKVPRGRFPKIVKRVGKSPPQYPDED